MKKIGLIPFGVAFLALSVSGTISNNLGSPTDLTMCTVTVDFDGGHLIDGGLETTTFEVRQGTLWKYAKKLAPKASEVEYNEYRVMTNNDDYSSTDKTGTQDKILDSFVVRDNTTIYPIYTVNAEDKVTVNWVNANGGDLGTETYVKLDTPTYKNDDPEIDDGAKKLAGHSYTFDKWLDADGNEPAQIPGTEGLLDAITYTANYIDVTEIDVIFDLGYDGNKNLSSVTYGGKITKPAAPTRANYTFDDWYLVATPGTDDDPFDFNTVINEDVLAGEVSITLFANWKNTTALTVDVNPNGGKFSDDDTTVKTVPNIKYGDKWGDVAATYKVPNSSANWPAGANAMTAKYYGFDGVKHDLTDATVFTADTHVIYEYTFNKSTITFSDGGLTGASTLPGTISNIEYGTTWKDIKVEPTNVATGYKFLYFYTTVDSAKTKVTDDFAFSNNTDNVSYTFYPVYEVEITFANDNSKGLIDYKSIKVTTDETWADYKFEPTIVDSQYSFKEFTRDQGGGSSTKVVDAYKFIKSETFTIVYENAAADNFSTDSWDIFLNYINGKTFAQITAADTPYYDDFTDHDNTFVGLTREVTLSDGNDYTVRVIDEAKADSHTLTDGGLFTFEFVDTIDTKVIFDTEPETYELSNLHHYLNDTFIHMFPSSVKGALKNATKTIYNGTNSGDVVGTKTLSCKLFPLSVSEYGFTGAYPDGIGENILSEGTAYSYYTGDGLATKRIKEVSSSSAAYWTRSLDITTDITTDSYAWAINASGTLGVDNASINPASKLNVFPAFVI